MDDYEAIQNKYANELIEHSKTSNFCDFGFGSDIHSQLQALKIPITHCGTHMSRLYFDGYFKVDFFASYSNGVFSSQFKAN